ncbi:MAG: nucleotidyl transferase AbiEii/AbiGii toxin family protein [Candidatus Margulisiibacteriota bacterium]
MEELLKGKLNEYSSDLEKRNALREYLQSLVLKVLFEKKYFKDLIFVGGTALRFIYRTKRFSEDLDFSSFSDKAGFLEMSADLEKELRCYNLAVNTRKKAQGNVRNAFIKFPGILEKLDLSPHKNETISIKLEIDYNPPKGGAVQLHLLNKDYSFYVQSYDLSSLMAGKLHAILFRKFEKGRDYYDLVWYLGKKAVPNIELLDNAIYQTQNFRIPDLESRWKDLLKHKIAEADFKRIVKDVLPFLEDRGEALLLSKEHIMEVLSGY